MIQKKKLCIIIPRITKLKYYFYDDNNLQYTKIYHYLVNKKNKKEESSTLPQLPSLNFYFNSFILLYRNFSQVLEFSSSTLPNSESKYYYHL